MKSQKKAFSLLELLVVILILGLLAGVVAPKIIAKGEEAKRDLACVAMHSIGESLKMFKLDNGSYPDTEEGLNALLVNPDDDKYPNYARSSYIAKLPKDSWGTAFTYIKNESKYELISFAGDRKEGGSEDDEDIFLSKCK